MKKLDELCINTIRMLAVDGVNQANSGHPGAPMGDAAMAYVLWTRHMRHNPNDPQWANRDRFVLSAGHASMLLYSLLHLTGYRLTLQDLKNFRQWGSPTPGHPEIDRTVGVETTTGPLGQGFATGVGMAMAERYLSEFFNRRGFPVFDHHIYGILSDGDLMEGVASESASLAGHLGLGRIVYLYSDNRITIDGTTDISFSENRAKRFQAYGWHVQKVDGLDLTGIDRAIRAAKKEKSRPSIIIARTHIGYGSPHRQDTPKAHGAPLGPEETRLAKDALGWPRRPTFRVPAAARAHFRKAVADGKRAQNAWNDVTRRYRKTYQKLGGRLEEYLAGVLPKGWQERLPVFSSSDGKIATRSASGKVLNAICGELPLLIGGSADLAASNNTDLKGGGEYGVDKAGRNIRFGVRKHAMGAALNGMALSGILPYGGTFLIFSDYMRPSIRLAALMEQQALYVFTHDSIGLGEDGPTHQPIEHLASLRAIPNLRVIRPADANETAEAWRLALEHSDGPTAIVLTRQGLPILDRKRFGSFRGVRRGGYVVADPPKGRNPRILLLASGSEVHIALEAHGRMMKEGIPSRVVNMACWELFEKQPRTYREKVLPPGLHRRVAVEAASPLGWERYTGSEGAIIGMNRFGASAPAGTLYEKFGITPDRVMKTARSLLTRR